MPEGFNAGKNLRPQFEQEEAGIGMHDDNLFDQDENAAGEKVDLATGKRIDNSTQNPGEPELTVFKRKKVVGQKTFFHLFQKKMMKLQNG